MKTLNPIKIWMPEQQVERQQTQRFHFENESDSENELNAIITEKGHLRIGVAQEKAINSYNETFECEVRIPIDAAEKLRDFLLQNFPDSKQVEQEPVKFEYFKDWMVKEMPPLTTIGNPEWWAKRIYDRFIYTTPQAREQQVEQEPVAWLVTTELQDGTRSTYPLTGRYKDVRDSCDFGEPIPLYTQYSGSLIVHKGCKATWANGVIEVIPVAREPLSEQAIDDLLETLGDHNNGGVAEDNIIPFVRAIEQHHNIGAKQ
jgi:hypothetical protein